MLHSLAPLDCVSWGRCRGAERPRRRRGRLRFQGCRYSLTNELSVIFHPADQRGPARVLPGKAEEVEARTVRDTAAVPQATTGIDDGQVDPRVVGAVAGRPDDRGDVELAAVVEAHRVAVSIHRARFQLDAVTLLQLAWTRADQSVARAQLAAEARLDRLVEDARFRQPPEEVAPEQPLRQRRLPRADRQHHP